MTIKGINIHAIHHIFLYTLKDITKVWFNNLSIEIGLSWEQLQWGFLTNFEMQEKNNGVSHLYLEQYKRKANLQMVMSYGFITRSCMLVYKVIYILTYNLIFKFYRFCNKYFNFFSSIQHSYNLFDLIFVMMLLLLKLLMSS